MATTGEECAYQKAQRLYFDSDYDLLFDSAMVHYCTKFRIEVVPAQRCGTCCSAFVPLGRVPHPTSVASGQVNPAPDVAERARNFLRKCMKDVCQEIERNITYLETQVQLRERRWQEAESWLKRPDTQPDALGRAVVAAEQDLSAALNEQTRFKQQLRAIKAGRRGSLHLEHLWLELEKWEERARAARRAKERAEAAVIERSRKEAQQDDLYARWEDAVERIPLLVQLREAVERYVEGHLAEEVLVDGLYDSDADHVLRFLKGIRLLAADDIPIPTLKDKVQELLRL